MALSGGVKTYVYYRGRMLLALRARRENFQKKVIFREVTMKTKRGSYVKKAKDYFYAVDVPDEYTEGKWEAQEEFDTVEEAYHFLETNYGIVGREAKRFISQIEV